MPHGGYHGTVVMGGNIVQQGYQKPDGSYGVKHVNIPVNQPTQTAAEAKAAREKKQKEISETFIDNQPLAFDTPTQLAYATDFGPDDAKARAQQLNFANQQLNNLLIAEQQAKNREGIIRAAQPTSTTPDGEAGGVLNKSDLLGYDDGLFGLNIGATPSDGISGIATVINPFTGEKLPTQIKAREGLTTPQYNQFISDLYDANPELYQETFPFASGQIAKPIFAKALEAAQAVGSGIAGLPGVKELGQMGGDIVGAMISPLSGLFTGETAKTDFVNPKAPTGGGDVSFLRDIEERFKPSDRKLPYIHSGEIPAEYLDGFTKFYQNYEGPIVGGAAITGVTLPDGSVVEFGDTGSARVFREYLESIGAMQPEKPSGLDAIIPPKYTGLPAIADYASMAPQFTGSQYINQGVSPAFLENLRRFYG